MIADEYFLLLVHAKNIKISEAAEATVGNLYEYARFPSAVPFLMAHVIELAAKAAHTKTVGVQTNSGALGHNTRKLLAILARQHPSLEAALPNSQHFANYRSLYPQQESTEGFKIKIPQDAEMMDWYELCLVLENSGDLKYNMTKTQKYQMPWLISYEGMNTKFLSLFGEVRKIYEDIKLNQSLVRTVVHMQMGEDDFRIKYCSFLGELRVI